jgi:hypothetical protein
MPKYIIECVETHRYEVTVEANNDIEAIDMVRDLDTDQIEEFEVDARWDYQAFKE